MAGKTGTAQVVGLNMNGGNGKNGAWKRRDHGHFICFAPFDNPRYACAVLMEHGGGSPAAFPIARDVMTYLFDPAKGMAAAAAGKGLGRHAAGAHGGQIPFYAAQYGASAPAVDNSEETVESTVAGPTMRPAASPFRPTPPAPRPNRSQRLRPLPFPPQRPCHNHEQQRIDHS
jgi:penicillin-binding protein 2